MHFRCFSCPPESGMCLWPYNVQWGIFAAPMELNEQQLLRRESLKKLRELGIEPYPQEGFAVNVTAADIKANYENDKLAYKNIAIAGRLMARRIMGKASFAELQDSTGRIQVYINRDG